MNPDLRSISVCPGVCLLVLCSSMDGFKPVQVRPGDVQYSSALGVSTKLACRVADLSKIPLGGWFHIGADHLLAKDSERSDRDPQSHYHQCGTIQLNLDRQL